MGKSKLSANWIFNGKQNDLFQNLKVAYNLLYHKIYCGYKIIFI